ncbi:hypothetical protein [Actinotalea sp. JY-7876]|uniref:hypothetical protein n=1 Tax=Actinotalea sp. JY-7876 TaxID=2758442 RepID=UPI0015F606CE|nr:hypothetical protein [Actinotalea sp. JY-7876]
MSTNHGIPAEHHARLLTASDELVSKTREHNRTEAARLYAQGYTYRAKTLYAYVDTCDAILAARTPVAATATTTTTTAVRRPARPVSNARRGSRAPASCSSCGEAVIHGECEGCGSTRH